MACISMKALHDMPTSASMRQGNMCHAQCVQRRVDLTVACVLAIARDSALDGMHAGVAKRLLRLHFQV